MRRLTVFLILLILLFTACSSVPVRDGLYDYSAALIDSRRMDLSHIIDSVREIVTETRFKMDNGEIVKTDSYGTGFILSSTMVITVAHVVMMDRLTQNVLMPFGIVTIVLSEERVDSQTFLVEPDGSKIPLTPLLVSDEDDIAIMSLPSGTKASYVFPYDIGNSDDVRVGNMVYVVGRPMNQDVNVREGIVSGLKGNALVQRIYAHPDNLFMISSGLVPGDSGAPIVAVRNGAFEIVGIAQGVLTAESRIGWGIRINRVIELIRSLNIQCARKCS